MDIPFSWEGLGSLVGIILFGIVSLFRGWVYPGSWVRELLKDKDAQLAQKDEQIHTLMEFQEPVIRLIETLNEEASRKNRGERE